MKLLVILSLVCPVCESPWCATEEAVEARGGKCPFCGTAKGKVTGRA